MPETPPSPSAYSADRPLTSRKRTRPQAPALPPVADTVAEDPYTNPPRNVSVTSISSPVDSAYSPRRSSSVQGQQFGAPPVPKARSGSVALPSIPQTQPSPKKQHRLSRSISAGVAPATDTTPSDDSKVRPLQRRPTDLQPPSGPSTAVRPPKPALRMLSTSFGKASDLRRPTEAPHGLGMASERAAAQTGFSPVATYNYIQETANKRMATLDYVRKVHEGQVYYFSTISYSASHLSTLPSLQPAKLGRRATNYLLLGTSLTPLLEFYATSPLDYLRALAALLSEFDTYTQLSAADSGMASLTRTRMGAMFKSGMSNMRSVKGRRASTVDHSLAEQMASQNGSSSNLSSGLSSIADSMPLPPVASSSHDFQYLQLPNLPFDPDFGTSFATLTDILMEAYNGLMTLIPGPDACVPGVAEAFAKADKQMRKVMLGGIANEFGDNTRKEAKAEVSGLGKLVLSGLM
ncbi:hypothetical protein CAC42_7400 [Sphaceloma murrayae]|uniref:Uncharacterized protein n=1 Tax=Sphaceloma murrayae TaxID=2082308 RepID=A0A2K1QWW9_9PEZI|nr:hypothetical protein CAC42_7400 [Sphaceloma murrayae]